MTPIDRESFGQLLAPRAPHHRALSRLHAIFTQLDPSAPLEQRAQALIELVRWIGSHGSVPASAESAIGERRELARLRLLVHAIEELAPCRDALAEVLASVLREASAVRLFAQLGLPGDRGLLAETVDRLQRRFLPEATDPSRVSEILCAAFVSPRDVLWLRAAPTELLLRLSQLLELARPGQPSPWQPLAGAVLDALRVIATRVSGVGLSDALVARSPRAPLEESPFFALPRDTDQLVASAREGDERRLQVARERCQATVRACRQALRAILDGLEGSGVSVDVVYRLELIDKNLSRYAALLAVCTPRGRLEHYGVSQALLVNLLDAKNEDRSLGQIMRSSTHLLARKIIERAGETGEHYITTTRAEYAKMLVSAGGGGVLTTFTAASKFMIGWGYFAPFVEGVLTSANYALSFILMQLCGLTLATKQPSMTAAALASSLRAYRRAKNGLDTIDSSRHGTSPSLPGAPALPPAERALSSLVTLIARITRSQLAAAIGNIGLVVPTTIAFDYFYRQRTGHSFLDIEKARYVLASLHPTESGSIFFAALTGVLLWAGSICAGWLENWAVYHRVPEAIAQHRLGRYVGRRTMEALSRALTRNIAGFGGNGSLGFLLGMTPSLGKFFGLPLEIRHVTLSTAGLTLGLCTLVPEGLTWREALPAVLGIGVIGAVNFSVSFVLALLVALRAREVESDDRLRLLSSVAVTLVRSPLQFVFPPRSPHQAPVHGPITAPPPPPTGVDPHAPTLHDVQLLSAARTPSTFPRHAE